MNIGISPSQRMRCPRWQHSLSCSTLRCPACHCGCQRCQIFPEMIPSSRQIRPWQAGYPSAPVRQHPAAWARQTRCRLCRAAAYALPCLLSEHTDAVSGVLSVQLTRGRQVFQPVLAAYP